MAICNFLQKTLDKCVFFVYNGENYSERSSVMFYNARFYYYTSADRRNSVGKTVRG